MAGVACGVKESGKHDLTLIVADRDAVAAGVYTQNRVQAAAVIQNRKKTPTQRCRAVVINSGNANACTGQRGMEDARSMAVLAADACQTDPSQVLVMSTGIIGIFLPMEKIAAGVSAAVDALGNDQAALDTAIQGMMTTDRFPKVASKICSVASRDLQVTGLAKGAGMIGPRMATMLSVVLTDAVLTPADAQRILKAAVDVSFNCCSVEGHMSTSDTVVLLASGDDGGDPLAGASLKRLGDTVRHVCIELAKMIPDDGEGASHLMTIDVRGCATHADARMIAQTIAESALVKTAVAGADPNWGRIVSAAGYAGVAFDPNRLQLAINGTLVFQGGTPTDFDEASVSRSMDSNREVVLELTLQMGDEGIRFWASDLTIDYVKFNSEYTT
jgi:glutamate N-acetyltransferase/amino-acid N-acetyltransferase